MPDPEIDRLLTTQSPTPQFVAETRQLLSDAWASSTPNSAPETPEETPSAPTAATDQAESRVPKIGDRTLQRDVDARRASRGKTERWWLLSSAAALIAVCTLGVLSVMRRSTSPIADPTTTTLAPEPPPSLPVVADTNVPSPTASATVGTSPDTVFVSTTRVGESTIAANAGEGPTDLSKYAPTPVPEWAKVDATAPIAAYPADGVYASIASPTIDDPSGNANDATVTFYLDQAFMGAACWEHFADDPDVSYLCGQGPEAPNELSVAWESERDVSGSEEILTKPIGNDDDVGVIATYRVGSSNSAVTYQVPFDEFLRGLTGATGDLEAFQFRLLVRDGRIVEIVSLGDDVAQLR